MRAVLQRVSRSRVTVEGRVTGEIAAGLMILLGVGREDTSAVAASLAEDRKSTRLNSSHGYISYAVFCLKKKKKTNSTDPITSTWTHPRVRPSTHAELVQ